MTIVLSSYSDVRCQERQKLGYNEDELGGSEMGEADRNVRSPSQQSDTATSTSMWMGSKPQPSPMAVRVRSEYNVLLFGSYLGNSCMSEC